MARIPGHIGVGATAALLVVGASTATAAVERNSWEFDVLLNDKKIGVHRFDVTEDEGRQVLETAASFDVRVLFINAFRYRHQNTETWTAGCLTSIDAKTDNNGDRLVVAGSVTGNGFSVSSQEGDTTLSGCVKTFAYWNPSILNATRLLNSQTGEYEDVAVSLVGREDVSVGNELVAADRYTLTAKGGDITLWYAREDQRWLALEAPAKGGRTIRYEPVKVPAAAERRQLIAGSS